MTKQDFMKLKVFYADYMDILADLSMLKAEFIDNAEVRDVLDENKPDIHWISLMSDFLNKNRENINE